MPAITRAMATRQQPFRLLDLPPELWLCIGEYAVTSAEPLCINHKVYHPQLPPQQQWAVRMLRQPAICSVNSVMRKELLPLYYRNNTLFGSNSREGLVAWLRVIGRDAREQMGQVLVTSIGIPYSSPRTMILYVWTSDEWDARDEVEGEEWASSEEETLMCCTGVDNWRCYRVSFKSRGR